MKPELNALCSPITDNLLDAIAAEADADRRSVTRRLAGLPVRGRAGRRIDRVLNERAAAMASLAIASDPASPTPQERGAAARVDPRGDADENDVRLGDRR